MTFDSVTFQSPLAKTPMSQDEGHTDTAIGGASNNNKTHEREDNHEYSEKTQISNCEDESRNHPHRSGGFHRNSRIKTANTVTEHIEAADILMQSAQYDAAYDEIEAATNMFVTYKSQINDCLDDHISRLSTLGCRATPPHPVTLPLVRLRRKLTA